MTTGPRVVIGWPHQIPLYFHPGGFASHRLVVSPELVLGADPVDARATFQARLGYRAVWHPGRAPWGLLAGLGSTMEAWPVGRPSLSPEIGVRYGDCCARIEGAASLVVRADAFAAGDDSVRVSAALAWSFY